MLHAHILSMFHHHYWVNQRLFIQLEKITEEEYTTTSDFPHGGIRDTLAHLLFADLIWRMRLMDEPFIAKEIGSLYEDAKNSSFAELKLKFEKEKQTMQTYINSIDDQILIKEFTFQNTTGDEYTETRIDILTHVIMHAMQHASEIAQMLTLLGYSPGEIDYRGWVLDSKSAEKTK